MIGSEWALWLMRVVVLAAASAVVAPLTRRASRKGLTAGVIIGGILLSAIPTACQMLEVVFGWHLTGAMRLLSRLDAPGFAMILFGVVLALRNVCKTDDRLRRQNEALRKEASTDYLTGLLNRRQANLLLDYGAARARRSGDPLGFIMIDLDRFKLVNDRFGHQTGDAVLAHVARLLRTRIRTSDILARYGGEEFLVVLPEGRLSGLLALAEELRILIKDNPTIHAGKVVPITASLGVSISRLDDPDAVTEAIGKADAAMYAAKGHGRNRVMSYGQCESAKTIMGSVDHRVSSVYIAKK